MKWFNSWRVALRMARADARRHRLRSWLAVLALGLPLAAAVLAPAVLADAPNDAAAVLRRLPAEAQAQLQALALPRSGGPLAQPPEGLATPPPIDTAQLPATTSEIAAITGAGLAPYWTSGQLLLGRGDFDPFDPDATLELEGVVTAELREAGASIWPLVSESPDSGRAPVTGSEVVVPTRLAQRMGVGLGDQLTIFGPPATGWMGGEGRIDEVLAGQSRGYTVVGLADTASDRVWALDGWLSAAVAADEHGINQRYLLVGQTSLSWDQVKQLNQLQVVAVSREVLTNYPAAEQLYPIAADQTQLLGTVVTLALGGLLGLTLLLFTVTPAFTVSAEQSRRTLGLAAAGGAAPADLRRIICAQGVLIGLTGGLLGVGIGLAAAVMMLRWRFPDDPVSASLTWWVPPSTVLIGVAAGWLTALAPAQEVSRRDVIAALAGRTRSTGAARRVHWVGPAVLVAGAVIGSISLRVAAPTEDEWGVATTPLGASLLIVTTFVVSVVGALLCLNLVFNLLDQFGNRLGSASRLALGDARLHRRRAWPAAAAVLVCTTAITVLPIELASADENTRDQFYAFAAPGHLIAGPAAPVSDSFDTAVLALAAREYGSTRIVARHDIRSWDYSEPQPQLADDGQEMTQAGQSTAWLLGGTTYLITPEGLKQSGLPGAEDAAEVLAAGGVVVNSPDYLAEDGRVRVEVDDAVTALPAVVLPRFGATLTLGPAAAEALGVAPPRKVGEYWQTARPVSAINELVNYWRLDQATNLANANANHGRMADPMTLASLALLVSVGVGAALISIALARTQAIPDMITMSASGATPGFIHRFGLLQALVLLLAGLPLGALLGLGLGSYLIAWRRQIGFMGEWRSTVMPLGQLAVIWLVTAALCLAGAALVTRKLPALQRPRLD